MCVCIYIRIYIYIIYTYIYIYTHTRTHTHISIYREREIRASQTPAPDDKLESGGAEESCLFLDEPHHLGERSLEPFRSPVHQQRLWG